VKQTTTISSEDELRARYSAPESRSTVKVRTSLSGAMKTWLSHSPFFVLSSVADAGIDCSPRGDSPGNAFSVVDDYTIAIPDRKGNNRIDTLRNILKDPRVGLVFLIPGIEEALRIKGTASISIDPSVLNAFSLDGIEPSTVLLVKIQSAYVQNARAIRSARLWDSASLIKSLDVPTAAELHGLE